MTDVSFCYWLQGFFELAEPKELNSNQVNLINNHLQLVIANTDDKITIPFIYWLEGMLSATDGSIELTNNQMNTIMERLQKVFLHIIDPKTSAELQPILNFIHSPNHNNNSEKMRC